MRKRAVFVEGQAELIFTREFLLREFEYQDICIECYSLIRDNLNNVPYSFGDRNVSSFFYMIINVGNDNSVLSKIKKRADRLCNSGFDKILGLQDIYGEKYRKENNSQRTINSKLIADFIQKAQDTIDANADKIRFFYAIMEVEAWFLGINTIFTHIDKSLTSNFIKKELGYDLDNCDPEKTFYHPAKIIGNIFGLVGRKYDKHESEVNELIAPLQKEHYEKLRQSERCSVFTDFTNELIS